MPEFKKQIYTLQIDSELKDLLPSLSNDEFKQLENNIINNGYDEMKPIWVWHGFIADGHNRYNICQKHKIPFTIIKLGYETKSEVMKWMIEEQLGRRNLTSVQRIAIAKKYEGQFKEEAKKNLSLGGGDQKSPFSNRRNPIDKKVNVLKEIANLADVGNGTLSRYNVVIKSNDEDTKKKMLNEEITINAAYNIIRPKPKPKEKEQNISIEHTQLKQQEENELETLLKSELKPKIEEKSIPHLPEKPLPIVLKPISTTKKCLKCKQEKSLSEFTSGTDFCDECMKHINEPIQDDSYIDDSTEVGKIIKDLKTPKVAADYIVVKNELLSIKESIQEMIDAAYERIFERYDLVDKMTQEDKDNAISYMNQLNGEILKLKFKIEKIEIKGEN